MSQMFYSTVFNGDISGWDVSNVEDMDNMFQNSEFDGNISKWNVKSVKSMEDMFKYSEFSGNNGSLESIARQMAQAQHIDINQLINQLQGGL
jgi:surface protein